MNTVNICDS